MRNRLYGMIIEIELFMRDRWYDEVSIHLSRQSISVEVKFSPLQMSLRGIFALILSLPPRHDWKKIESSDGVKIKDSKLRSFTLVLYAPLLLYSKLEWIVYSVDSSKCQKEY